MLAYLVTTELGVTSLEVNPKFDIYGKLKAGRLAEESLNQLSRWPAGRRFWLGCDGSQYRIRLKRDGAFTATLGGRIRSQIAWPACPYQAF